MIGAFGHDAPFLGRWTVPDIEEGELRALGLVLQGRQLRLEHWIARHTPPAWQSDHASFFACDAGLAARFFFLFNSHSLSLVDDDTTAQE